MQRAGVRIGAVIVTYFPDATELGRQIDLIGKQVDVVVLIDNTPADGRKFSVSNATGTRAGCDVVELGVNAGLAAAQNVGLARLRQHGCDFAVLLDQDSAPAAGMVSALHQAWRMLSLAGKRVGAVGPNWTDPMTGTQSGFVRLGIGCFLQAAVDPSTATACCDMLISSGCLIPMAVIDDIGGMDARLFIDHVDNEWCVRAQRFGYELFGACHAHLRHGIGERRKRVWLARWRHIAVHSPVREYYKLRNMLTVYFLRPAPWRWRMYCLMTTTGLSLATLLMLSGRRARLRMMLLGLRDALAGRLGPFSDLYGPRTEAELSAEPGATGVLRRLGGNRIRGMARHVWRRLRRKRSALWSTVSPDVAGRTGIEIGGPSPIFDRNGPLPVYTVAERIDNCNFSRETLWEAGALAGGPFIFDRKRNPGRQFTAEATDLRHIETETCAFLLSSHTLEHCANPLKALGEWRRVLRPGGLLVLVLPHKDATFDRRRPVSSLDHLQRDFDADTPEDDATHLAEVIALHDLALDPWAGSRQQFEERSRHNPRNRGLHHHVFDSLLAARMVDRAGLLIEAVEPRKPWDIIVVARKTSQHPPDNQAYLHAEAPYLKASPFPSDRSRGAQPG